jgi:hypothetical protein
MFSALMSQQSSGSDHSADDVPACQSQAALVVAAKGVSYRGVVIYWQACRPLFIASIFGSFAACGCHVQEPAAAAHGASRGAAGGAAGGPADTAQAAASGEKQPAGAPLAVSTESLPFAGAGRGRGLHCYGKWS